MKNKSNITNAKYQSTFLPLLSRAETEIKELIIKSALFLKSKAFLRSQIKLIIERVAKNMPQNIIDRQTYIEGLYFSSERMIKKYYDRAIMSYLLLAALLLQNKVVNKPPKNQIVLAGLLKGKKMKIKKVDKTVVEEVADKFNIDIEFEAKGYPNVENYEKRLEEMIGETAKDEIAPAEEGKKKITVWQKAELDVRHEAQIKMIDNLVKKGITLAWISSHPDCSKRCSRWQGSLVSLKERAESPQTEVDGKTYRYKKSSFKVGKEGKHTVYSLPDIMDVIVKPYGYKNNIIGGFNCRHKLVPYTKGSVPPTEYNPKEVEKQREINKKMREFERKIRELKRLSIFYKTINAKKSKMYLEQAKKLTKEYKKFAEDNGYAWLEYRLEV